MTAKKPSRIFLQRLSARLRNKSRRAALIS
jgi:hypothetical protein